MATRDSTQSSWREDVQHLTTEQRERLGNFGPAIDKETARELEESAISRERATQRRLCLAACEKSADELSKFSVEAPEAFGEMLDAIEAFATHTKALHAVADVALMRMTVADRRKT